MQYKWRRPGIKFKQVSIQADGSSIWCDNSQGKYAVTSMETRNLCDTNEPYELVLHGPKTKWEHYTDNGIEANVNRVFVPLVQKAYPNYTIVAITWSEQGMQPEDGWSFDIHSEERAEGNTK
jgi:hypothetical protein